MLQVPARQAVHQERKLGYLPHVDGLRALAIIAVVAFHAAPKQVPGGFVGVDIFFVISGFLITSLLCKDIERGNFSLWRFLERRARRIVPALAVVVLAAFAAAWFILPPREMTEFGKSLSASALFSANVHFYKTTDYFALTAQQRPLLHTWSLAIEEQFYLIWPLVLLLLVTRLKERTAIILLIGAICLSFAAYQVLLIFRTTYAFYMPQTRAWALLIGALLAIGGDRVALSSRAASILAAAGLAGIAAAVLIFSETAPYPGLAGTLATLSTAAIILACMREQPFAGRILASTPLVWIGLISYSLYLWHWPVLTFARLAIPERLPAYAMPAMIVASVALAWLSWRYVERPFRTANAIGPLPASTRSILAGAAVVLVSVAVLGAAIKQGGGWAWRWDADARSTYQQVNANNPFRKRCDGFENAFADDAFCNFGPKKAPGKSYDLAVFGDSNADHFVPTFALLAAKKELAGRQVTQSACPPLFGARDPAQSAWQLRRCRSYQETMLQFLDANPDLKLVILSASWSNYQTGLDGEGVGLPADLAAAAPKQPPAALEYFLDQTVALLEARGLKVLIVGRIPPIGRMTQTVACAIDAKRKGDATRACPTPLSVARNRLSVSTAAINAVLARHPGASAVFPTDTICDDAQCYAVMDGVLLYHDEGHLNSIGAELLANYLSLPDLHTSVAGGP